MFCFWKAIKVYEVDIINYTIVIDFLGHKIVHLAGSEFVFLTMMLIDDVANLSQLQTPTF